ALLHSDTHDRCSICACRTVAAQRLAFFFFQAEDGIRDYKVTGVQTCALPISPGRRRRARRSAPVRGPAAAPLRAASAAPRRANRSEERRVGKECRARWCGQQENKKLVTLDDVAQGNCG